jgi:hypothetical protein
MLNPQQASSTSTVSLASFNLIPFVLDTPSWHPQQVFVSLNPQKERHALPQLHVGGRPLVGTVQLLLVASRRRALRTVRIGGGGTVYVSSPAWPVSPGSHRGRSPGGRASRGSPEGEAVPGCRRSGSARVAAEAAEEERRSRGELVAESSRWLGWWVAPPLSSRRAARATPGWRPAP